MKVYISVDMEGVAGVVDMVHTNPNGYDYQPARRLMTKEANAAIEGALAAGAAEVWVADSHGGNGYRSILGLELHEEAYLITGTGRRHGQLEGLDSSFDALMLVGYHVRHGAFGVLSHTTNGKGVDRVTVNGREVGEIGLNAALAGSFGVPTVLITGDDVTVAEAQELIPGIEGAAVKRAMGRYAALGLHPSRARDLIRTKAEEALRRRPQIRPFTAEAPVTVEVRFKDTGTAEVCQALPGAFKVDDSTVAVTCADYPAAYRAYRTMVGLYVPAWGDWIRSSK